MIYGVQRLDNLILRTWTHEHDEDYAGPSIAKPSSGTRRSDYLVEYHDCDFDIDKGTAKITVSPKTAAQLHAAQVARFRMMASYSLQSTSPIHAPDPRTANPGSQPSCPTTPLFKDCVSL